VDHLQELALYMGVPAWNLLRELCKAEGKKPSRRASR
jgi:hypothetical protein